MQPHRVSTALFMMLELSSLGACRRDQPKAEKASVSAAELAPLSARAKQGLSDLTPPLTALAAQYAQLHREFDPLPPGLPGFGDTRAKFYSAAIGVGTLSAKVPWLHGHVEAAAKAGDRAELESLVKEVAQTRDEIRRAEQLGIELQREVQPFKQLALEKADEIRLSGKAACE